ncbi:hypothetical protein N431DRAFT_442320 [Stipitochalara longipes BDJ]|nr:hypothetical protein N431DRAFT_442320 [Stipitochalara longipes BDJ]
MRARTAVKQIELFFHASMAASSVFTVEGLRSGPGLAERGEEVLKREKDTGRRAGGHFPLTGGMTCLPGSRARLSKVQGPRSKESRFSRFEIDAHQLSEIGGHRESPWVWVWVCCCSVPPCLAAWAAWGLGVLGSWGREMSRLQQRSTQSAPEKRKIFIKEAIWSSKCLKAGWWMRPSARPRPIIAAAGASVPMTARDTTSEDQ